MSEKTMKPRWYVVNVYAGSEKRVVEAIKEQTKKKELESSILEVLVPTEEVTEIRRGEKVRAERKFFPGYVLVKMIMTDEAWHLIRSVPKVSGFLGGKGKPSPISEADVQRIMHQIEEGVDRSGAAIVFEVGEHVRVCDGPFVSFSGLVEEVDAERCRLKILVSILGRMTPIDVDFSQVEKVQ